MPFASVGDLERAIPAVRGLRPEQKVQALSVWNAAAAKAEAAGEHLRYTAAVVLGEDAKTSVIEVLRVGTIQDRGLVITAGMLADYVRNFKDGVYGVDVQVNLGHDRDGEAAGWIRDLYVEDGKLMAQVEWTELGAEKVGKKLFQYVSSELAPRYPHADTGKEVRNVFIGAALTNVPALKRQQPVTLSEEDLRLFIDRRKADHSHAMLTKLIEKMQGRATLSAEDMKLVRELLAEATAEEQATHKDAVAKLEEKVESEDEKTEEEKAAEAAAAKEKADEELNEKLKNTVPLSEHNALKEKFERKELAETVQGTLLTSKEHPTGFRGEAKDKVVEFMLGLSEAQRTEFTTLMADVVSVDYTVRGSAAAAALTGDDDEKTVKLAEQLMKDGKAKTITEAQKMAAAELAGKK